MEEYGLLGSAVLRVTSSPNMTLIVAYCRQIRMEMLNVICGILILGIAGSASQELAGFLKVCPCDKEIVNYLEEEDLGFADVIGMMENRTANITSRLEVLEAERQEKVEFAKQVVYITCGYVGRGTTNRLFPHSLTYLHCPPGCAEKGGKVTGNIIYADYSYICRAAIHDGRITDAKGGLIVMHRMPSRRLYRSSLRNGVQSTYSRWAWASISFVDLPSYVDFDG